MKTIITFALALCVAMTAQAGDNHFGKKIKAKGAISASELTQKMSGKETVEAKVSGTVESVCQMKGCWMKVKMEDGTSMRVTFKDYGFFVPKDIAGKTVVFEGTAKLKTTPVAELRHYAEDAGKSKAEIEKITDPEKAVTFVADGVVVKD